MTTAEKQALYREEVEKRGLELTRRKERPHGATPYIDPLPMPPGLFKRRNSGIIAEDRDF